MLFENFYASFHHSFEARLSGDNWLLKVTLFAVVLSLFLAFPPYHLLISHFKADGAKLDAWVFVQNQAQDLLHPKDMAYHIRRENMVLRWTLPLLSWITNHNVVLILIAQALCGILFLYNAGKYVFDLSGDKVLAGMFVLSVANIFVSVWTFADIHGYGDGFAYFALLSAMLSRNRVLLFIFLQIAFFTDERAVIAGGYLLLWWIVNSTFQKNDFRIGTIIKAGLTGKSAFVWIAWLVYFGVRNYVLANYFPNHNYSTIGTPVLFSNEHRNGLGSSIWSAFEGTWLLIGSALLALILTRHYLLFGVIFIGICILMTTGIFVHDIDRALAYGFPFLLISFLVLYKTASLTSVKLITFFTMVICVLHPQVFYMGFNKILWLEPFPMKLFMMLDKSMAWGLFG
jgi:hypothetical protein